MFISCSDIARRGHHLAIAFQSRLKTMEVGLFVCLFLPSSSPSSACHSHAHSPRLLRWSISPLPRFLPSLFLLLLLPIFFSTGCDGSQIEHDSAPVRPDSRSDENLTPVVAVIIMSESASLGEFLMALLFLLLNCLGAFNQRDKRMCVYTYQLVFLKLSGLALLKYMPRIR